jgi:hypothetical protein
MQIILFTQYRENYGAHDWDGLGECPQYWKNKGGYDYVITDVDVNSDLGALVEEAGKRFGFGCTNYSEEYLIAWECTSDGELTSDEKVQMVWDGKVINPSKRISMKELA